MPNVTGNQSGISINSTGINAGTGTGNTYAGDHNNVFVGGPPYAGIAEAGPNDIELDPEYVDANKGTSGNYLYTNETVLTGDDQGGPIGYYNNFLQPLTPTPSPTPSPNRVGRWSIY